MYRNQLASRMEVSEVVLWRRIDAAPKLDDATRRVLRSANLAAGATVGEFGLGLRELGKRTAGKTAWRFVRALGGSDEAVTPPHRVVTWAFLARHYGAAWPDSYERLIGDAERAIGIANDAERRIATYGPLTGLARTSDPPHDKIEEGVDEDTQHLRFVHRTIEATVEVTLGQPTRLGSELHPTVVPMWAHAYGDVGLMQWESTHENPELVGPLPQGE